MKLNKINNWRDLSNAIHSFNVILIMNTHWLIWRIGAILRGIRIIQWTCGEFLDKFSVKVVVLRSDLLKWKNLNDDHLKSRDSYAFYYDHNIFKMKICEKKVFVKSIDRIYFDCLRFFLILQFFSRFPISSDCWNFSRFFFVFSDFLTFCRLLNFFPFFHFFFSFVEFSKFKKKTWFFPQSHRPISVESVNLSDGIIPPVC